MRYHVKERSFSLNDSFNIHDETGKPVYTVSNKLIRIWDSFTIRDAQTGEEVLTFKQKIFSHYRQYQIYGNGGELATLERKDTPDPSNERYEIATHNGQVLRLKGNFQEWDFELLDHYNRLLAHISREWSFPLTGDRYTVDTAPGSDPQLVLAITVLLDEIREDFGKD
jgi:uncharacterized protein YxjI